MGDFSKVEKAADIPGWYCCVVELVKVGVVEPLSDELVNSGLLVPNLPGVVSPTIIDFISASNLSSLSRNSASVDIAALFASREEPMALSLLS